MPVDKPKITLTKRAVKAISDPGHYYALAMTHLDDLVWLLEPAQDKISPEKFKANVRNLVEQMVKEREAARRAVGRQNKLIRDARKRHEAKWLAQYLGKN